MKSFKIKKRNIADEFTYPPSTDPYINSYIKDRLLGQIRYYDQLSKENQRKYKFLSLISAILSAGIPVLTICLDYGLIIRILIAILGGGVCVITSIMAINNSKQPWDQHRYNCEILKSVLHRYFTKSGEFEAKDEQANFRKLVQSCEEYFTKEYDTWTALQYDNNDKSSIK